MRRGEAKAADEIKKITFKFVKYYRGKGPQYVNVRLNYSNITIYIKGVFTNLDKLLYENADEEKLREVFKGAMLILKRELLEKINEVLNVNCTFLSIKENYIEDSITIIIPF
ncbi:Na-translocating system protein MpsC family protein [Clostridium sp. JN-9]|uniref:Na-translocating system protein MpsC family protein n=1 Tax=Clostridium sp. JN-9 TaxID=2507159 RepID=UPI000FFE1A5F|nr:Na-translocating system protein MpsC family protein [Clostridium sp. JN-9]QAT40595.1 DUF2294 family protein [Clostridium sp. JN-9]